MTGNIEILIIVGVVVLLFGASAIPKIARSIGKAKKEFQKGLAEGTEDQAGDDAGNDAPASDDEN